jgi:hypothetical protein
MQHMIRSTGRDAMQDDHDKFIQLHHEGKLVSPEDPGHVLVALANNPPKDLSGQMCSWNDEKLKDYVRA